MTKKMKAFKGGGKIKRYAGDTDGSYVSGDDFVSETDASVLRALRGERPSAPEYTQLPPSKDGFAKAVQKAQKSNADIRSREATMSRGARPGISQIPGQSMTAEQREGINRGERVTGTETSRNVSNALSALTPLGGGVLKVGNELALGGRSAKAAQAMQSEGKLSAAGQRLKNMEEVRNVANPGRAEAVMNPSAWAGGPRAMEKVAQIEEKSARAAATAARKKAAQAKKDAKDPVMNARPGADKAKSKSKYETDEPMDSSFGFKKGGSVQKFAKGGSVSSASSRADGCAVRGKTKGTISKMKSGGMYGGKGAC